MSSVLAFQNVPFRAGPIGTHLQLFKWTWENPRPDAVVTSLDFVSAMTEAAPFVIAITAE